MRMPVYAWRDWRTCLGPRISDWRVQLLKFAEEGIVHAQRLGNEFPWACEMGHLRDSAAVT